MTTGCCLYCLYPTPSRHLWQDWLALIIGGLLQCLGRCVGLNLRGLSGLLNPSLPDQLLAQIRDRLRYFNARFARHAAGLSRIPSGYNADTARLPNLQPRALRFFTLPSLTTFARLNRY